MSRSVILLVLTAAILITAIIAATAVLVSNFRDRALSGRQRELANITLILAEQTQRAFEGLELVQDDVVGRMRQLGIASSEDFKKLMSGRDVHLMLQDKISALRQIAALTLIDSHGELINFNRAWPIPSVNVSDRDYFKALAAEGGPTTFLSEPVHNRGNGAWSIFLARKFTGPHGEFLGIVLGAVDLQYFETFFGRIALEPMSSIDLFRRDGLLLARYPRIESLLGHSFANGLSIKLLQSAHHGVGRAVSLMDKQERIIASHAVPHFPLVVSVTTTSAAALSEWNRQAIILIGAGIVAALLTGGIVFLTARHMMRELGRAERRLTQEKAKAEEADACLRDAFEVVPEGLVLFDAEDRFVMWNRRMVDMYGDAADGIGAGIRFEDVLRVGLAKGQYLDAEGREEAWLTERLRRHAEPESSHEHRLPGGRWIRVHERRTANGGSIGVRIDITELKEREESFRLLFDSNPVPMWVYDRRSFRFLAVNDAAVEHYGYSRQQFLEMTLADIEALEGCFGRFRIAQAAGAGEDPGRTWRHRKRDRTEMEVAVYLRNLPYQGYEGALAAMIDFTERKRAEDELRRTHTMLDMVIENVPATIFVKDARDLRYRLVNRAGEDHLGCSRSDIIGNDPFGLFDKETAEKITLRHREVLESGRELCWPDHTIRTPGNGARVVTSKWLPLRGTDGNPQYLLGVIDDITERRALEQQLQQAQKMEAIGNLTGGIAHDFNNLLTVITGNVDLLRDELAGNATMEEKLGSILRASLRGGDLIKRMLAFSRRQTLQPKPTDINELVINTRLLLARTLEENIRISLKTAADVRLVLVDQAQMEAALLNIAINARDAMPAGGELMIETRSVYLDAADLRLAREVPAGDYVLVEISDTGTGMPPDVLQHIFEPFFTTKAPGSGTGLGLSMVYGFVKQSKGHLTASSEVGQGTTFKLYLPQLACPKPISLRSHETVTTPPNAESEVILVVDDNPSVRAMVVMQLSHFGYRVLEAAGGEAALAEVDRQDHLDLLFTDIMMPGMDGKELARRAVAKRRDLKVLFTSGFSDCQPTGETEPDRPEPLLRKPYRKEQLANAVRAALDGRELVLAD